MTSWAHLIPRGLPRGSSFIPEGVTRIESYAFMCCNGIDGELILPSTLTSIGPSAFQDCLLLTKVTMPNSVISIGDSAFSGCINLSDIILSKELIAIGDCSFQHCGLINISFPESLQSIGSFAFESCTKLTGDLIIPDSVKKIGNAAFSDCTALNGKLKLSNALTEIPDYAFQRCSRLYGDLIIPEGIVSIGAYSFYECEGFEGKLILPDTLETLNDGAFRNCRNIEGKLIIPDKVSVIGLFAFENLAEIDSIVFGESFNSFGEWQTNYGYSSFSGCMNVRTITFTNLSPAVINANDPNPFQDMYCLETIYVPEDSYDEYVKEYTKYVESNVDFVALSDGSTILNFHVERQFSKSVELSWNQPVDDEVIEYVIYRDNIEIGRTYENIFVD